MGLEVGFGLLYIIYVGVVLSWLGDAIESNSVNTYEYIIISTIAIIVPIIFVYIDRWIDKLSKWQIALFMIMVYAIPTGSLICYDCLTGVDIPDIIYTLLFGFCTWINLYIIIYHSGY